MVINIRNKGSTVVLSFVVAFVFVFSLLLSSNYLFAQTVGDGYDLTTFDATEIQQLRDYYGYDEATYPYVMMVRYYETPQTMIYLSKSTMKFRTAYDDYVYFNDTGQGFVSGTGPYDNGTSYFQFLIDRTGSTTLVYTDTNVAHLSANFDVVNFSNVVVQVANISTLVESTYDVSSNFNGYILDFYNYEDVLSYEISVTEYSRTAFSTFVETTWQGTYTVLPNDLVFGKSWYFNSSVNSNFKVDNKYTFDVTTVYDNGDVSNVPIYDDVGGVPDANWIGFTPTYNEVSSIIKAELLYNKLYITSSEDMTVRIKIKNDNMKLILVDENLFLSDVVAEYDMSNYGLVDGTTVSIYIYDVDDVSETGLISGTTFSYMSTGSQMSWRTYENANQVSVPDVDGYIDGSYDWLSGAQSFFDQVSVYTSGFFLFISMVISISFGNPIVGVVMSGVTVYIGMNIALFIWRLFKP